MRRTVPEAWRRLALPLVVVIAAGHMAKGLAKFTSWGGFLPGGLRDPVGVDTVVKMSSGSLPTPSSLVAMTWVSAVGVLLIVITADIPLAAEVVANGGQALNPRGELYTDANVGERLATRNLLDKLRDGGQITGGPANSSAKDRQAFANQLDRWLTTAKD